MAGVNELRQYDSLLTTTLAEYQGKLSDSVFDVYPMLSYLNGTLGEKVRGGKKIRKMQSGGESIVAAILYGKNSTAKAYAGAEQMDTTPQEGMTIARYNWKQYGVSITITGREYRANKGKAQLINLLEEKTKQAESSLRDLMNPHTFGDGTAINNKSFTGWGAILSTTSTLGGIAPTSIPQWKAVVDSAGFSWAANGRSKLRTMFNNLSYGNDTPGAMFTDQTTFEYVEASLEEKERIGINGALDLGFDSVSYKKKMITWDRDCTAGQMIFINPEYINFYVETDANMKTSKFVQPHGQDALSASIIFEANMVVNNRRMFGLLSGITA